MLLVAGAAHGREVQHLVVERVMVDVVHDEVAVSAAELAPLPVAEDDLAPYHSPARAVSTFSRRGSFAVTLAIALCPLAYRLVCPAVAPAPFLQLTASRLPAPAQQRPRHQAPVVGTCPRPACGGVYAPGAGRP